MLFFGTNFKPQKVIYFGSEGVVIMCIIVVAWMEKCNLVLCLRATTSVPVVKKVFISQLLTVIFLGFCAVSTG